MAHRYVLSQAAHRRWGRNRSGSGEGGKGGERRRVEIGREKTRREVVSGVSGVFARVCVFVFCVELNRILVNPQNQTIDDQDDIEEIGVKPLSYSRSLIHSAYDSEESIATPPN